MSKSKRGITRRTVLAGLGATVSGSVIGCGSDGDSDTGKASAGGSGGTAGGAAGSGGAGGSGGVAGSGVTGGTNPGGNGGGGAAGEAGTGGTAGEAGAGGTGGEGGDPSCTATNGLTPSQLLAKIEHVVVLCMENRSFDHYLGSLKFIEGLSVDGLTGMETNPAPNGGQVFVHQLDDFTPEDPPHGWDACHNQFNGGLNDGFVREHAGSSQEDVMGYHVRSQLPITYALADAGAICDRYYASVMGPTWPNRFYLHCGSSNGGKSNLPQLGLNSKSIWARLNDANISNVNYYHDLAWALGGLGKTSGNASISKFFEACMLGTLPQFSLIDPQFFGAGANDDHPDHDVQLGQALISTIVAALASSSLWNKCLFVITYDEHGGFYDHVPPPQTTDERSEFQQLGFRVPSLVLGPHVRRGCVVSAQLEHASLAKTLSTRFGIPHLNDRVAAANDFSTCIDPYYLDNPAPAPVLPQLSISRSRLLSRPRLGGEHPEMAEVARRLPHYAKRISHAGLGETEHVLRWGQELGALRVR
ncbi:MAG: alkaline phosphatase family protein [Polyangiaceae bacterium]